MAPTRAIGEAPEHGRVNSCKERIAVQPSGSVQPGLPMIDSSRRQAVRPAHIPALNQTSG